MFQRPMMIDSDMVGYIIQNQAYSPLVKPFTKRSQPLLPAEMRIHNITVDRVR